MTYLEKVLSGIRFDDELFTASEIETLREILSWQIQDQLCPADIAFLRGPGAEKCADLDVGNCSGQCWNTEAAADE